MAAEGEIIKSFLVGLGFDVNESSLAVFNKSIKDAAVRVTALYGTVNALAGGIVFAFAKISQGFEQMGYQYHIIAPAVNKMIVLRNEMMKAYSAAGINIRKVIVDSIRLNYSLAKTRFAMEAIYKSVGSRFFGLLTKQSDAFRKKLYENMPYIISALEKLVKFVFKAFEAVTLLGVRVYSILSRIYDFFVTLDKATNGWSTVILGVIAAWKLLNFAFLATPLGMIIGGLTALLALWDDFKTFKEGGKSFFNWGPAIPIIEQLTNAFTDLFKAASEALALLGLGPPESGISKWEHFKNLMMDIAGAFTGISNAIDLLARKLGGDFFNKALDWRDSVDKSISGFFSGSSAAGNAPGQPLGTTPPHQVNTNANMQTQINITGSANADATARATAAQQQNVNRDFARNLKGATR